MVIWGVVATLQAVAGSPEGMYPIRFFLGIFEAAFISGAPYLTTVLYPRKDVSISKSERSKTVKLLPGYSY